MSRPHPLYILFLVVLCLQAVQSFEVADLQMSIIEPFELLCRVLKRSLGRTPASCILKLLMTVNNRGLISLGDDVETKQLVRSRRTLTGSVVFTDYLREKIQEFGLQEIIDKFPQEEWYSADCLNELVGILKTKPPISKVGTVLELLNSEKELKTQLEARVPESDDGSVLGDEPEPVAGPSTGPGPVRTPGRTYTRFNPYETPGSNVVQRLRRSSTMPSTPSHCRSINTMPALAPVQEIPPFRPIIHDDAMSIDDPDFFVGPLTPPPSDPRPSRRPIREFDDDDSGNAPAPPPHDDATCPVQPRFVELQEQQLESQARIGALEAANAALVQARDWTLQLVNMIKLSNEA